MARKSENYINNKQFSEAVFTYVKECNKCEENGDSRPVVPNYIAMGFKQIAEGLSHKPNFISYSYRDEMVMDAIENCLKAIRNYNIEAATRTGNPNAFAYFTQISWYAFLRRIAKEKKQQDVKLKYLSQSGIEQYILSDFDDTAANNAVQLFVDQLKDRIDKVKERDTEFRQYVQEEKIRKKRVMKVDSDLQTFMDDE